MPSVVLITQGESAPTPAKAAPGFTSVSRAGGCEETASPVVHSPAAWWRLGLTMVLSSEHRGPPEDTRKCAWGRGSGLDVRGENVLAKHALRAEVASYDMGDPNTVQRLHDTSARSHDFDAKSLQITRLFWRIGSQNPQNPKSLPKLRKRQSVVVTVRDTRARVSLPVTAPGRLG